MLLIAMAMVACKAKVDLDNIDPTMKLEMGLAVPVGTIRATLGDFLRIDTMATIHLTENGTYVFEQQIELEQAFSLPVDLTNQILPDEANLPVKDQIQQYITLPDSLTIAWIDMPAELQQDIRQKYVDENIPDSLNVAWAEVPADIQTDIMNESGTLTPPDSVKVVWENVPTDLQQDFINKIEMPESMTVALEDIRANVTNADDLIYDQIFSQGFVSPGQELELHYPVVFDMDESTQLTEAEMDSIDFSELTFVANLRTQKLDFPFNFIQEMSFNLPENVHSKNGQTHIDVPLAGKNFGQDIEFTIQNFNWDLTQQKNINIELSFKLFVPKDYVIKLEDQSALHYQMALKTADINAIYGQLGETAKLEMDTNFTFAGIWEYFGEDICLPVAEPQINLSLAHNVAAPLRATIHKLDAYNSRGQVTHAQFNGAESYVWKLNSISPDADLYEMAESTITLDKNLGTLDKLIASSPERFDIGLTIDADNSQAGAQRMSKTTNMKMTAGITLPFTFNPGTKLSFKDTVAVEFKGINYDSIAVLDQLDVKKVQIVALIRSYIPFDLSAKYIFLDNEGHELPLDFVQNNQLLVAAPTAYDANGQVTEPGVSTIVLSATPEQVERLKQIDKMVFELGINDIDQNKLQNKQVVYPVAMTKGTAVELQLSVTANAAAYLKMELGK